jgi:outer membrane protein assembly factor BamB
MPWISRMVSPKKSGRPPFDGLLRISPTLDPDNHRLFIATTTGFGEKSQNTNTTVYCIDMEDGQEMWSSTVAGASFTSLCYDQENERVFLSTMWVEPKSNSLGDFQFDIHDSDGAFYCLDAENGDEVWSAPLAGGNTLSSSAAAVDGIVYVTHGNMWFSSQQGFVIPAFRSSALYAFDINDGSLLWKYSPGENSGFAGSPSVSDGRVYVAMAYGNFSSEVNAVVACLDAISGFDEWKYTYQGIPNNCNPVVTPENIVFVSNDANVYCLNKENGRRLWNKKVSDIPSPYFNINYYAAAAGDYVFTIGNNYDTQGRPLGFRQQIFEISSKGKSVYKEDFKDDSLGISSYGKSVFYCGFSSIYQIMSDIPELNVSPTRITLGDIERDAVQEFTLNISNRGAKGLEGTVSVSESWLSVENEMIDDTVRSVKITVQPKDLELMEHVGRVIFTSNGGNVTIPVSINVVDTTPPVVTINTDDLITIDDLLYTNQVNYVLKGLTEATAIVVVQGKDAELDADGIFEIAVELKEGENEIIIDATDEVGNEGQSTFVLYLDSKAPALVITTPNYKLSIDPNDYIMGTVDDLKSVVTINGEELQLAPNGSFAKMVFLARGVNEFVIQAKDRVGNVAEHKHYLVYPEKKLIILFIGRKTAEINGIPVNLDVPPRIMSGRTMVPFRFVGEAMGAEVGWEASEQKITLTLYGKEIVLRIGSTTAIVNGNPIVLDAPPTIIGGRTLVPIRFVSESLGAKVDWEGTQQRITITFPAA